MAQVAQQDNLVIEVSTAAASLEAAVKNKLIDCIKAGTITDVILVTTESSGKVSHAKVISYLVDTSDSAAKYSIFIVNANGGTVSTIALN